VNGNQVDLSGDVGKIGSFEFTKKVVGTGGSEEECLLWVGGVVGAIER